MGRTRKAAERKEKRTAFSEMEKGGAFLLGMDQSAQSSFIFTPLRA